MKDMSKVKPKNVGKVAKELIKNPHATQREIAKATGMSRNTVIKAEEELSQNGTKDPVIAFIVDASKERIKRAQAIFDRYLDEIEVKDTLDRGDVSLTKDIIKDDLQRVTVLGGDITNDQGGLKEIKILLPE